MHIYCKYILLTCTYDAVLGHHKKMSSEPEPATAFDFYSGNTQDIKLDI